MNELYVSLGLPDLRGWSASGGDPCEERWQGMQCVGPNITAMYAPYPGYSVTCMTVSSIIMHQSVNPKAYADGDKCCWNLTESSEARG